MKYDPTAVTRAREAAGFVGSQGRKAAAEKLGVTKRHYDRWEQVDPADGKLTRPNLEQLCALALLFNVPVGFFFCDETTVTA